MIYFAGDDANYNSNIVLNSFKVKSPSKNEYILYSNLSSNF